MENFERKFKNAEPYVDSNILHTAVNATISNHGEHIAMIAVMEELAELQKEVSKEVRGFGNYFNLLEEMADVVISLEILKSQYNISSRDLKQAVNVKTARLYKRNVLDNKNKK